MIVLTLLIAGIAVVCLAQSPFTPRYAIGEEWNLRQRLNHYL